MHIHSAARSQRIIRVLGGLLLGVVFLEEIEYFDLLLLRGHPSVGAGRRGGLGEAVIYEPVHGQGDQRPGHV